MYAWPEPGSTILKAHFVDRKFNHKRILFYSQKDGRLSKEETFKFNS